jgi:hypothetical protein
MSSENRCLVLLNLPIFIYYKILLSELGFGSIICLQYLIANASTAESKVFYLKMKGDYYRSVARGSKLSAVLN